MLAELIVFGSIGVGGMINKYLNDDIAKIQKAKMRNEIMTEIMTEIEKRSKGLPPPK